MSVNVSVVYIWKGNIAVHNFNCFLLLRIFSLVSRVAFKLDIFLLATADNFAVLKFLNKKLIVPSLPAIAARIICSLWFSDIFFRYCILRFTTVIICKEKKKKRPVWMVYELALDVTIIITFLTNDRSKSWVSKYYIECQSLSPCQFKCMVT